MQLVVLEHRAGLEVVPQAERVADFVHHRFLDGLPNQLVGHLVACLDVGRAEIASERQAQLVLHLRSALAQPGTIRLESRPARPCMDRSGCRFVVPAPGSRLNAAGGTDQPCRVAWIGLAGSVVTATLGLVELLIALARSEPCWRRR